MWNIVIAYTAGIYTCQQLAQLPAAPYSMAAVSLLAAAVIIYRKTSKPYQRQIIISLISFLIGLGWAAAHGYWQIQQRIPAELVKQELTIEGTVTGLSEWRGKNLKFDFLIDKAFHNQTLTEFNGKISLTWYKTRIQLKSGQRWRLQVKLKPPVGLLNDGLFDNETRLFAEGYRAIGYVRDSTHNELLEHQWQFKTLFDQLRYQIRESLNQMPVTAALAVLKALSLGDKSSIDQEQWLVFRQLGINHLVAISGLHISIVASLVYWMSGYLWRLSAWLCLRLPVVRAQAIFAIMAAFVYAGLAGFSLPTQRALLMLAVVLLSRFLVINLSVNFQLQTALIVVLLFSPMAIIETGFWLSFLAVIAIILSMQGYLRNSLWQRFVLLQMSIALMLIPVQLSTFGSFSLSGPLVNLVLIPVFSVFFVPIGLLLVLLQSIAADFTAYFLQLYLLALDWLLELIGQIADDDIHLFEILQFTQLQMLISILALIMFYLPFFRSTQWMAVTMMFYVVNLQPDTTKTAELLQISLLDVGQGLAVLVQQDKKTLLYDLGPSYGAGSATSSVVMPYLQKQGIQTINQLVISHSDNDHAGDYGLINRQFKIDEIYSGEPDQLRLNASVKHCKKGISWQWQDTRFKFINPVYRGKSNNNASCVLRIDRGAFSLLLTGDIEALIEDKLIQAAHVDIDVEAVVIPHHGSLSSSTEAFVAAVSPSLVLNSSGFLNRYHFPKAIVKRRWSSAEKFLDTAQLGQISLFVDAGGDLVDLFGYRQRYRRYWYWPRDKPHW